MNANSITVFVENEQRKISTAASNCEDDCAPIVAPYIVPFEQAKKFDHLTHRQFFDLHPRATHRTVEWLSRDEPDPAKRRRLAARSKWLNVARRDGFETKVRDLGFGRMKEVIINRGDGSLDHLGYGPLGIARLS